MSDESMNPFEGGFDVMGELDGVTIDDPKSEPIPEGHYVLRVNNVQFKTFDPPKDSGADAGRSVVAVEYQIVSGGNGDTAHAGRKIYTDYAWAAPTKRNEDGTKSIVPSQQKIGTLMSTGLDETAATEKAVQGIKDQVEIGKRGVKKLINACGFIDPKDTKPGDKNMQRIEAQTAVLITPDLGFSLDMLKGKVVMGSAKKGMEKTKKDGSKVQYLEVKNTWDVDPSKVGDVPF